MTLFTIIGMPLQHTLSPELHKRIFKSLGIEADYNICEVQADELNQIAAKLREGHLTGINITLPYKSAFLGFLDQLTEEASAAGAVNCVSVEQGLLLGHNTDVYGIRYALESNQVSPTGKSVLILGNGGAARAAIVAFQDLDAACIGIAGRRETGARQCLDDFRNRRSDIQYEVHKLSPGLDTSTYQLIVNATPIGMWPGFGDTPLQKEQLQSDQTVFDFIYHPERTLFLKHAIAHGCKAIGGIEMFIGQGLASQERWFPGRIFESNGMPKSGIDVHVIKSSLLSILAERESSSDRTHLVEGVVA